ncbi:MAG: DNA polymerase III subunit alpha [Deltaproteobacteria bacterium]|nr:DNA polymerase III subunit alpha [Deltaproteobacteria bacterium]
MADFAHLHVHSQYSMLDGAIRVKDLVKRTKALGMKAVALTDHGNMHGAIDFYKQAKDAGVKPLIGCELGFVFPGQEKKHDPKGLERTPAHHMVLIARNMAGYKNLIGLVSRAWIDTPQHLEPRVTLEDLERHRDGIIVLSGCLGGLVPQAVLQYSPKAGVELLGRLRDVVEKDMLFIELQDHGLYEQPLVNEVLLGAARDMGLPFVATNDCHYLERGDAVATKLLGCIAKGITLDDYNRNDHGSTEMFLKSPEEMAEVFKDLPEAVTNTMAVLERIEHVDPTHKPMLPNFRDEAGNVVANIDAHFAMLAGEGLDKRFETFAKIGKKVDHAAYRARLDVEVGVINKMGFPGYFLIVQDFINWSKANGIPVGPGRGSGAGSIVAYSLGITDIDPIPYNLLFERFLNPERVSMPDFDVDFCMLKREKSIEYVRQKYGRDSVGQIATFQLLKSKSVVRDVGRSLGMPFSEVDAVAKLIPEPVQGKNVSIDEAIAQEPRLKAMYDEGGATAELLDHARKIENMNRHAGMHAAGIVISEGPLWETVPVFKGSSGELVTQYAKEEVEYAGLVKFDFLGLTTLTVLDIAVTLVNKRPDLKLSKAVFDHTTLPVDVKDVPDNDPDLKRKVAETYELLQSGETTGVFQLESTGMQKLFKDLRPKRFEDIVAAVALYRPGPLGTGMVEDFVNRVNGRAKTEYPHPDLEEILSDTYGVITYQEQVMMIARKMGGYSLGGADMLRRAMGKKKPEEMQKQKSTFVEGALKNGYDEETATRIFDLLEYFAGYGFNKSHSAAYALITYHTAFLKAHYPAEFCCGTLTSDLGKIDKIVGTIAEARALGIDVLPPDVNESEREFAVIYDAKPRASGRRAKTRGERDPWRPRIRIGLGGVRGVGDGAVEAILEARQSGGNFEDIFDFCARADMRRVNKSVVEALVQSGAFDESLNRVGATRAQAYATIDGAIERGKGAARERSSGQMGLFAVTEIIAPSAGYPELSPKECWDSAEQLKRERSYLGFYLSGHPLDRYAEEAKRFANANIADLLTRRNGDEVTLVGVLEGYRERPLKTGGRMAFFMLEDKTGRTEVVVRARTLAEITTKLSLEPGQTIETALFRPGEIVVVSGKVQVELRRDENGEIADDQDESAAERKVSLNEANPLSAALYSRTRWINLNLNAELASEARLRSLKLALEENKGRCPVTAMLELPDGSKVTLLLPPSLKVDPVEGLLSHIEKIFGKKVVDLRS